MGLPSKIPAVRVRAKATKALSARAQSLLVYVLLTTRVTPSPNSDG
jgi:hypothetical protein